jgi:hypothetical protein
MSCGVALGDGFERCLQVGVGFDAVKFASLNKRRDFAVEGNGADCTLDHVAVHLDGTVIKKQLQAVEGAFAVPSSSLMNVCLSTLQARAPQEAGPHSRSTAQTLKLRVDPQPQPSALPEAFCNIPVYLRPLDSVTHPFKPTACNRLQESQPLPWFMPQSRFAARKAIWVGKAYA